MKLFNSLRRKKKHEDVEKKDVEEKKEGFFSIKAHYESLDEVQDALRRSGLESSNLIIGVDFTGSNEDSGKVTFNGKNLHTIDPNILNPYQEVIEIVGKTLEPFDDDKLIPAFGFGDSRTRDSSVFSFSGSDSPCNGFKEVLQKYNEITPGIYLDGPTSFAPLIKKAIEIVKQEKRYHILIIIADGQVSNILETANAIVEASHYPISIIMIGVGDGPWNTMEEFDDRLPQRKFDNFRFVPFHDTMIKAENREVSFSIAALQEIPTQYKLIKKLGYLDR